MLLRGRSHRQRLAGELPESVSSMNPSLDAGVAGVVSMMLIIVN
jgi:Flp pilus assembly protein TadB